MVESAQSRGSLLKLEGQRYDLARLRYDFLKVQLEINLSLRAVIRDDRLHEGRQKAVFHRDNVVAPSLSRARRILVSTLEQLRSALDDGKAEDDGVSPAPLANGHQNNTNGHSNSNGQVAPRGDLNGHGEPPKHDTLTRRELEVLKCIAEGNSTKELAGLLGITFKTASCHRSRVMDKLGVHNTAMLVRIAIHSGLVQP